jgi:hypothetical protein
VHENRDKRTQDGKTKHAKTPGIGEP